MKVISQALGGSSSSSPLPPADPSKAPKTYGQLEAALKRTLG